MAGRPRPEQEGCWRILSSSVPGAGMPVMMKVYCKDSSVGTCLVFVVVLGIKPRALH
jgi:hypothetical protein